MGDILNRKDIELLITVFYEKLLQTKEITPVFEGLNFQQHIPHIVSFWSLVLLDEEGYRTNVFDKHMHLPIKLPMFDIWLNVFVNTVNELFIGKNAELAKLRATSLTYTFKAKWQTIKQ